MIGDNPLEDTPERKARIEAEAYLLWEADGCPEGRSEEFWERARELIGMKESAGAAQLPNPSDRDPSLADVTIEEASIQQNLGEFPDRSADQGGWRQVPMTRDERKAGLREEAP